MTKRDPMMHIRVPESLKSKLEEGVKASGRSLNSEVVWRLENSFKSQNDDLTEGETEDVLRFSRISREIMSLRDILMEHERRYIAEGSNDEMQKMTLNTLWEMDKRLVKEQRILADKVKIGVYFTEIDRDEILK